MNLSQPAHAAFPPSEFEALVAAPAETLDAIPAAVYVCAADGLVARYNQRAVELWGRAPSPDKAECYCGSYRLYYPDGRFLPHDETPMAEALRSGLVTTDAEVVIERPDCSRITVAVNIRPLRDSEGKVQGAINCFQDISARKALEESSRRAHEDLDDFFENSAVGLHIVSGDGIILRANKAELDLLGYSPEEYIGRPITDFHEDQPAIADILNRLSCGEKLDKYPARLRSKDGSIKHVLITSNGRFVDGKLVNTRCFTVDITERFQLEEDLRERERMQTEILDGLPAAIYTTDAEGRILYFNRAAVEFSGRTPTIGTDKWCTTWRLYDVEGSPLPHEECPMAIALREGRAVRGAEAVAERPDGTRIPFIPYPTPLCDREGRLIGAVNMLVDITERKEAENRQAILIEELNHRVKNTLATVQSLAASTATGADSIETFFVKFNARVKGLAKAHDLLTRGGWRGAELRELISDVLEPYADQAQRIDIAGPNVHLQPRHAIALTLAVGELATNAVKHGSLSVVSGSLKVSWNEVAPSVLRLEWMESGREAIKPPTRRGFGTRLIERIISIELGGDLLMSFTPPGLRCEITFSTAKE